MAKLTAIDLFSGCGGLTLGLKQAGFSVIGAVEIDPLAVQTYKKNHQKVEVWTEDIRTLEVAKVMRKLQLERGELSLLAGCPPCQGFSTLTTLNGRNTTDDPRNDLIFHFMRFVRGLMPRAIMMENVPGLGNNHRIEKVFDELKKLGYECTAEVLNAADYGVPQRRRRFILLAGLGQRVEFAPKAKNSPVVRTAFSQLDGNAKYDPLHNFGEKRSDEVMRRIRLTPPDGGSRSDLGKDQQLDCHKKSDGFKDIYGRMSWDKVAPTITTGCFNPSKGRFLHPVEHRAITLREAALWQSFPKTYYFSLDRGKIRAAEMIGNALPPEFIRRQALEIKKVLTVSGA